MNPGAARSFAFDTYPLNIIPLQIHCFRQQTFYLANCFRDHIPYPLSHWILSWPHHQISNLNSAHHILSVWTKWLPHFIVLIIILILFKAIMLKGTIKSMNPKIKFQLFGARCDVVSFAFSFDLSALSSSGLPGLGMMQVHIPVFYIRMDMEQPELLAQFIDKDYCKTGHDKVTISPPSWVQ